MKPQVLVANGSRELKRAKHHEQHARQYVHEGQQFVPAETDVQRCCG